ncbi:MAG: low molecular weight phosphotyrosine protein phosphatase [Hydrogenophilus sp.]|nr:low molecular weight phosphotyrosine protein phosphatase [Hydrogenophilus sp.]
MRGQRSGEPIRVLCVCTGNICRSPTAEVVLRQRLKEEGLGERVVVDSAGIDSYHVGEAPDPRMQQAARRRGYDLSELRARQVQREDFFRFDWVLAMDRGHLHWLQRLRPPTAETEVALFLARSKVRPNAEVPDPYYRGPEAFEEVLDWLEEGARGWVAFWRDLLEEKKRG